MMNWLWRVRLIKITIMHVRIVVINLTRLLSDEWGLNLVLGVCTVVLKVLAWLNGLHKIWLFMLIIVLMFFNDMIFVKCLSVLRFLFYLKFFNFFLEFI